MEPTPTPPPTSLKIHPNSAARTKLGRSDLDELHGEQFSARRLERSELEHALRKGLGRALIHVLQHGLEGVDDLVLDACLHDQNYDGQCDPCRGAWLHRMFAGSPHHARFRDAISSALATETDTWTQQQLFVLVAELAARGDTAARHALAQGARAIAASDSSSDWMGAELWVEIAGADAALELARIYGRRMLNDPRDWPPEATDFSEETGRAFDQVLVLRGAAEPELEAYWKYLVRRGCVSTSPEAGAASTQAPQPKRIAPTRASVDAMLARARAQTDEYPGPFTHWGRKASAEELAQIWSKVGVESDEGALVRLLWVFRRAPLPDVAERVLTWAESASPELRRAALEALSMRSEERIHALARSKARSASVTGPDLGALDLFRLNYAAEDAELIARALSHAIPDVDEAHSLVWSVTEIAQAHEDPALVDALRWAYEHSPCMLHREQAVEELVRIGRFDEDLRSECEYDAHPDIRGLARKQRAAGQPAPPDAGDD